MEDNGNFILAFGAFYGLLIQNHFFEGQTKLCAPAEGWHYKGFLRMIIFGLILIPFLLPIIFWHA
jgi:hypothetical protein